MTTESIKFTKRAIEAIEPPVNGRDTYRDNETTGLQLRVTPRGVKTFILYRKLDGVPKRVTLGRFPELTVEKARKEAQRKISDMLEGKDPNKLKRARRDRGITLAQCLDDYLIVHRNLKPSTQKAYRRAIHYHLKGWRTKPMSEINRNMVATRHRKITESSPVAANNTMRVLRALFNFAHGEYEDEQGKGLFPDNPVTRLSHHRQWNKEERRQGKLKPTELPDWFRAVRTLSELQRESDPENDLVADYLVFVLLTGMRRREAATLEWDLVDFKDRSLTVTHTKNGNPLTLPLSDYLLEMLERRQAERINEFVFPGRFGKGFLNEPKKQVGKVKELSGIEFTIHDLRRTFISIAESLDISPYAVKRLVNHSTGRDVTAGYIIWDIERLREPTQKITDYVLKAAGISKTADIINLENRNRTKG